ncbi:MAG: molybdenum cofactor biosynthesis protein MoaE [Planctomycetes bacterium]|nr:molybdenum cofactor biosynthesis protein MoaE [Planctomycetota bacterium]
MNSVILTTDPLDVNSTVAMVSSPFAGAIDVFIGTVRNSDEGREVSALYYEAHAEMAKSQLSKILQETKREFDVIHQVVAHRLGLLKVGEPSTIIAVASAHRAEAFSACRQIIERLKVDVPIWKKEHFKDADPEWLGV